MKKKLFLIANVVMFTSMFANSISLPEERCTINSEYNKTTKKTSIQMELVKNDPVYYQSSCGMWVTTTPPDNWGWNELIEWSRKIEANYCSDGAPYSSISGVY